MNKNRNTFWDFSRYLNLYKDFIGRKIYIVFTLATIASLSESIGILMLIPIFSEITDSSAAEPISNSSSGFDITYFVDGLFSLLSIDKTIVSTLLLIVLFFTFKGLITFCALAYNSYLRGKLLFNIKTRLFEKFARMQYLYYIEKDAGHFANIMNEQAYRSVDAFRSLVLFVTQAISAFMYFIFALLVSINFGLMSILIGIFLVIIFKRLNNFVRELSRKIATEKSHLLKLIIQSVQGFKYLSATNRMEKTSVFIKDSMQNLSNFQIKAGVAASLTQSVREPLAVLFLAVLMIIHITYIDPNIAPILVSIVFFYRGLNTVVNMQGSWQNSLEFIGSIELISQELIKLQENKHPEGKENFKKINNEILFSNVTFDYKNNENYVLGPVNLKFPVNTTIALIGESGSGKSTIADLVNFTIRPNTGNIFLDNVDSSNILSSSWQKKIGYVSQEAVIFNDTIANNISFYETSDANTSDLIIKAAKNACIHDFIQTLPNGYNTEVGDRGVNLSGGQKQRLFIARELFRNPQILILDEATGALDVESEKAVQNSIDILKGTMTVIVIAHRLSTIRNVDYIYLLKNGKVFEEGNFRDLRDNSNSTLNSLINAQKI